MPSRPSILVCNEGKGHRASLDCSAPLPDCWTLMRRNFTKAGVLARRNTGTAGATLGMAARDSAAVAKAGLRATAAADSVRATTSRSRDAR